MDNVRTVGELRELLRYSEDEEPLVLKLDNREIECISVSSSGGGRITILWFEEKNKAASSYFQI